ncbi:SpaH/EbpB family LPXTG-anchored major pilin [Gemmiger formicilis]|jgi:fimbrial isopeptide formation D2 family protein/LPXTG-motif cell wall-anchored protein|uniref:SpaH/EbpB family LPXTG-anchored major pilin n=1 Tax=Gemmiger formicilis TaxID=745368 RepID=UPI00352080DD
MKLKRLFTAILSVALTLSLCAMPAMAEGATTAGAMPKTSTSTIDKNQKGSITIYKRALDSSGNAGTAGDGETMVSPQGAALKDTGFTLYQVMDTNTLLAYYNDNTTADQVDVKDYFTNYAENKTAAGLKTAYATAYKSEVRTDENGKATFTELPVGMYLVIETKTPQAVTMPVEPFLVSIPMTRIGDKTTGADNQNQKEWLYDVTVYPKNSIAKGTVRLVKQGKQGSTTTPLAGVKFTLNKKNDTDDDYTAVKTDVATDTNGKITLDNLAKGRYYLQETGYTDGNDKGYILNTTGKFYFDIDENGKAVKVDDTIAGKVDDASFTIDSTHATLTVTNYKPDIVKTVTKRDGTTTSHEADYGVGDAVPYTLTIKVPENITSLKTFTVTDTTVKAQLIQNKGSVKISGKNNAGGDVTLAKSAYTITVAPDANNSVMTVAFTPSALTGVAGGEITIAYTATVQSGAIVAGDGNVNTAKIVYSRKTNLTDETGGNKPYEITDKGVVYTFGLNIHKTAKGGTKDGAGLKDVTFDLYKKVDTETLNGNSKYPFCGQEYAAISGDDAVKLGLTTNSAENWIKVKTLTTGENGYVSAKGLPSGTYKLVETKTVNGYNLLSKPVDAKLNLTYAAAWSTTTTYDANGNQTKSTITTPTYKRDGADVTDPSAEIEIVNRAGFTLPVTGGFGTLLFSGIGVLLVLAGVGVLFSLKKKSNRA